ncbi:transposase [Azospirillum lipoferum]|uniref:Transposase n=1 Tax=Azospirillum lipoferum TaxID=193 RepID=A0A5A9G1P0_AZOLI|nr:transposase [Azospirillum lipoferum]
MGRYDLTDAQWERLEPHLPPEKPRTGRPNHSHRRMVNSMLLTIRSGAPWRDLPERYGTFGTVSSRFYRWHRAGLWQRILEALQARADRQVGRTGACTSWTAPWSALISTRLVILPRLGGHGFTQILARPVRG